MKHKHYATILQFIVLFCIGCFVLLNLIAIHFFFSVDIPISEIAKSGTPFGDMKASFLLLALTVGGTQWLLTGASLLYLWNHAKKLKRM